MNLCALCKTPITGPRTMINGVSYHSACVLASTSPLLEETPTRVALVALETRVTALETHVYGPHEAERGLPAPSDAEMAASMAAARERFGHLRAPLNAAENVPGGVHTPCQEAQALSRLQRESSTGISGTLPAGAPPGLLSEETLATLKLAAEGWQERENALRAELDRLKQFLDSDEIARWQRAEILEGEVDKLIADLAQVERERDAARADLTNVRASLTDGPGATEAESRRLVVERNAARAEAADYHRKALDLANWRDRLKSEVETWKARAERAEASLAGACWDVSVVAERQRLLDILRDYPTGQDDGTWIARKDAALRGEEGISEDERAKMIKAVHRAADRMAIAENTEVGRLRGLLERLIYKLRDKVPMDADERAAEIRRIEAALRGEEG